MAGSSITPTCTDRTSASSAGAALCFAAIAIVAGAMLVTQRNPVHAALSFAMVVLSTCGLFLLQVGAENLGLPFLATAERLTSRRDGGT